jgi:hypothetical protein
MQPNRVSFYSLTVLEGLETIRRSGCAEKMPLLECSQFVPQASMSSSEERS